MNQFSSHKFYQLIQDIECSADVKDMLTKEWNKVVSPEEATTIPKSFDELKKANESLKRELKVLKKKYDFNQILFARVAHEIRTPLHGILGMINLMEKTPLNTNQKEYTGLTKSSAENLLVIVNDILLLSKTNVGQVKINNQPFSIIQFLKDLESLLKMRADEKEIQLSFQLSKDLPEILVGDKTRLFQILLNLLNNAIKYTNQGYIKLSVDVIKNVDGEVDLRFVIKDTGIGIKAEKLSLLFNSFSRVHEKQMSGEIEGLGLGLNIVKKLTKLLNGKISVDSKFGVGSEFTLSLPFGLAEKELTEERKNIIHIPTEWKDKKFLLIEDNEANILYSKEIFDDWGLQINVARDLKGASEKLITQYDCILSDVKLPDGNGLDFISDLRQNAQSLNKDTPCIVLTASRNEDGVIQFEKEYIQGYLSKPFSPEKLFSELERIIIIENPGNSYLPKLYQPVIDKEEKKVSLKNSTIEFKNALAKRFKSRTNLMIEMVKIFLDQSPVMLDVLENAPAQNDYERLRFESHKFKSTVNIIGLTELRNYSSKVETAFENDVKDDSPETIALIQDFIKQLKIDEEIVKIVLEDMLVVNN